jgi:hypothetical protein
MTRAQQLRAALGAALAAGAIAAGSAVGVEGSDDAVTLAARLAEAPVRSAGEPIAARDARAVADEHAAVVPLPAGGTFNGIRWEQVQGVVTHAEIAGVLEYNAVCQWLRAWRDGREGEAAPRVLALMPAWPGWREGEAHAVLAQIAAEVEVGRGATLEGALADCDAAQAREAQYAAARGLPPTR